MVKQGGPRVRKRIGEQARREQILKAAFEVASREGLGGLTVRAVAAEAHVSHALVLFHFGSREQLMQNLLEWLIATTSVLHVSNEIARLPRALDRLHALLQQEVTRLAQEPRHTRLFLEFWALGALDEAIRERITAELRRYRAAFLTIMEELVRTEPSAYTGVTAEGMAAVAVSWIQGCAVQAMLAPADFDTGAYLRTVRSIVGQIVAGADGSGDAAGLLGSGPTVPGA